MSTEKLLPTPPIILESGLPSQPIYPKTPLKIIPGRPFERRAHRLYFLGFIMIILGYIPFFTLSSQTGSVIMVGMAYGGVTVMMIGLWRMRKIAKEMKCKGCGKEMVKTPYCPFCGEYDPLGDYEDLSLRTELDSDKKGWRKFRPWFL